MKSVATFLSLIGVLQSANCEGGGPSVYGYDASSVCNKPYNSRTSRAYVENLPCDFRHQNWCTVAGSAYPWHAVRRFVQENQGLMRRMYGIERHIDILKEEFEKNDVELEYDDRYERYLDETRVYHDNFEPLEYNYEDDDLLRRRYMSRNIARNGKLPKKYHDENSKGYYRRSRANDNLATSSSTVTSSTSVETSSTTSTESLTQTLKEDTLTSTSTTTVAPITTTVVETTTDFEDVDKSTAMNGDLERSTSMPKYAETPEVDDYESNSTTGATFIDKIDKMQNLSINEVNGQIDRLDADVDELTEITDDETIDSEEISSHEPELRDEIEASSNSNSESYSSTRKPEVQSFRPRPEYKPTESKHSTLKPDNSETQQYHPEMDSKNHHRETVLKLRGVNACPVKDEVVAPLWANNTRGEILALINHYPFEQYVHWEKCTHENKQMYCRDGCRCEQQYRLHRLLAFDPNNECRGIFSDWFKFPSCCVCRCYDLPLEFRVTSRSPRILKRKIKIRTPQY